MIKRDLRENKQPLSREFKGFLKGDIARVEGICKTEKLVGDEDTPVIPGTANALHVGSKTQNAGKNPRHIGKKSLHAGKKNPEHR